jgi:hypothetical protein
LIDRPASRRRKTLERLANAEEKLTCGFPLAPIQFESIVGSYQEEWRSDAEPKTRRLAHVRDIEIADPAVDVADIQKCYSVKDPVEGEA